MSDPPPAGDSPANPGSDTSRIRYREPLRDGRPGKRLVMLGDGEDEVGFVFFDRIEIGRFEEDSQLRTGGLLIPDPTVSSRHCILTRAEDGRCFVRDVSRNGTRIDDRRLVPNLEMEIRDNQVITVGNRRFRLESLPEEGPRRSVTTTARLPLTQPNQDVSHVTVLVGDIRDYTVMVRTADPEKLQRSVSRVFAALEKQVFEHGGTVKEYQGDAIFAFWEKKSAGNHAVKACRAALALHRVAMTLAEDGSWDLPGHPLRLDWALASGPVKIQTLGGDRPTGLSMIGEPVVLAFRLEKFADDASGPILACRNTHRLARAEFAFRGLGERQAKGFEKPDKVFALEGETP